MFLKSMDIIFYRTCQSDWSFTWIDDLEQNVVLTGPYTEEDIMKAFFQMEHNKASGLDGFPAQFCQTF
jgi:hypothetical protein